MKRSHRRAHALLWLILIPVLVVAIYQADQNRLAQPPAEAVIPQPSGAGVLP